MADERRWSRTAGEGGPPARQRQNCRSLVPAFSLAENHTKGASAKGKALFNATGDGDFVAVAGNAKILAVNPHPPRAIVNLKNAVAERSKRVRHGPVNAHILAGIAAGIFIDI